MAGLRLAVLAICLYVSRISADVPVSCMYEDIRGTWIVSETDRVGDNTIDCTSVGTTVHQFEVYLDYPNIASDALGHQGTWTMVWNQGFEFDINSRKYFAFSKYEEKPLESISICNETMPGSSHDVLSNNWACFSAVKKTTPATQVHARSFPKVPTHLNLREPPKVYRQRQEYIEKINSLQKSWTAKMYPKFEGRSLADMNRMRGTTKTKFIRNQKNVEASPELKARAAALPANFDWRNINGQNFISPVRDQQSCGSCYSFASTALYEARLRLYTNNALQTTFSPQDVVSCDLKYSQGCAGGFDYLVAGKYAEDYGLVEESCNTYLGKDGVCTTDPTCRRYYVSGYHFIGDYYGGCTEEAMKETLVKNGPISVSFNVQDDFSSYSSGIYVPTGARDEFNPFEPVNHNVLLVGYGVDGTTGEKYWICKNSWGLDWGEAGYFRIIRGVDALAIESMAFEAFPIVP